MYAKYDVYEWMEILDVSGCEKYNNRLDSVPLVLLLYRPASCLSESLIVKRQSTKK